MRNNPLGTRFSYHLRKLCGGGFFYDTKALEVLQQGVAALCAYPLYLV